MKKYDDNIKINALIPNFINNPLKFFPPNEKALPNDNFGLTNLFFVATTFPLAPLAV